MQKVVEYKWNHNNRLVAHQWHIYCPGCKHIHAIGYNVHQFNGDLDKPTFSPSLLVEYWKLSLEMDKIIEEGKPLPPCRPEDGRLPGTTKHICHSFVRDGVFEFLWDCTHDLKNQHVPVPDITPEVCRNDSNGYVWRENLGGG